MKLSRADFLMGAVGLAVAGVACGDDPPPSPPPTPTPDAGTGGDAGQPGQSCEDGTESEIANNHGHTLLVSAEDVSAAVDKSYDITGDADHPHTVTVTSEMFAQLVDNDSISVTSSTDASHNHTVTISCA